MFCWAENVPNTKTNAFEECYIEYDTLHVPAASVAAYGEKEPWKYFKNIVSLTGEPRTEDTENSIAEVRALPVLIKTNGSQLTIEGIDDGEQVNVFGVDGVQQGQTFSQNGVATLNTSLPTGSVTIVKIGQNSVKVVVK